MSGQMCRFALHYRGRHDPEDALWWLDHPTTVGPSGAAPPQQVFLEAVDELQEQGLEAAANALLDVLADLMEVDRRASLDALRASETRPD